MGHRSTLLGRPPERRRPTATQTASRSGDPIAKSTEANRPTNIHESTTHAVAGKTTTISNPNRAAPERGGSAEGVGLERSTHVLLRV